MPTRKETRPNARQGSTTTTGLTGRTRRRTEIETAPRDETQRGRRLFEFMQTRRQGTEPHSGAHEPTPRREEQEAYSPAEALPSERGASRGKRIAWSIGALTALGGFGAFSLYRRNQRNRREEW